MCSANIRPDLQGKIRTGYAGFRSKVTFISLFRVACLISTPLVPVLGLTFIFDWLYIEHCASRARRYSAR